MKNSYITVGNLEDKVHPAKPKNRWKQGSTYPWHQVAQRTIFCTVALNIFGFSVWSLFQVSILAPKIFRWFLDFWKTCPHLDGIMLLRDRV
jgi:hypothetical protein